MLSSCIWRIEIRRDYSVSSAAFGLFVCLLASLKIAKIKYNSTRYYSFQAFSSFNQQSKNVQVALIVVVVWAGCVCHCECFCNIRFNIELLVAYNCWHCDNNNSSGGGTKKKYGYKTQNSVLYCAKYQNLVTYDSTSCKLMQMTGGEKAGRTSE